ncbi:THO complex subunit 1-like [Sinocyclocheilus grahami]|uniref:THO complex subunit 1-like n=1 Tax=Sinocyclocheilus grahami TaxID=75366 RepID=UPI0007ACA09F|nr:PREDICTED: THO complex subunit 1-like [Sinocyclocheilus grahami]
MCNDLLRRLSKSQNTVFCGRIQLFLARLFPLSEKSGLNLQSQFNLDNITVFNKNEQDSTLGLQHTEVKEEGMEEEEGEMGDEDAPAPCSIPIDYNLYRKFWTLQDYFRNPVQCYDKFSWMTFLKKDLPSEEIKTGEEDDDENGDNLLKESNDSPSIQSKAVTNSQMDEIAAKLGSQWKTLADHLEMSEKEIRVIESDSEDVELQAKMLLVAWQDREGPQATMESLVTALNSAGFNNITEGLSET